MGTKISTYYVIKCLQGEIEKSPKLNRQLCVAVPKQDFPSHVSFQSSSESGERIRQNRVGQRHFINIRFHKAIPPYDYDARNDRETHISRRDRGALACQSSPTIGRK